MVMFSRGRSIVDSCCRTSCRGHTVEKESIGETYAPRRLQFKKVIAIIEVREFDVERDANAVEDLRC